MHIQKKYKCWPLDSCSLSNVHWFYADSEFAHLHSGVFIFTKNQQIDLSLHIQEMVGPGHSACLSTWVQTLTSLII